METPKCIKFKSQDLKKILSDLDSEVRLSPVIAQPEMRLGFHHFIHRTKDLMRKIPEAMVKSKLHYIVNPFEVNDKLESEMKKLLNFKEKTPDILSRAFYKKWEMLIVFDLVEKKELTYAALAEAPGSFLQAVLHYRKKYLSISNDKYFAVSINPEDGRNLEVSKNFIGYYKKKNPELLNIHKTYKRDTLKRYKSKDNGDLTDVRTISNFRNDMKKSNKTADLVSGDGGFNWIDENYQEQESYPLIIGQILGCLGVLDKGGNFVLKFFETFTELSCKLVYILTGLFEESYFYKPYFSRLSNSEKYFVGKGYKYSNDDKNIDLLVGLMMDVLKKFNSKSYVINAFPRLKMEEDFLGRMKIINIMISNKQQIIINEISNFIDSDNYYGTKYHEYLGEHQESINYWISNFVVDKEGLKKTREKWVGILNSIVKSSDEEVLLLLKD